MLCCGRCQTQHLARHRIWHFVRRAEKRKGTVEVRHTQLQQPRRPSARSLQPTFNAPYPRRHGACGWKQRTRHNQPRPHEPSYAQRTPDVQWTCAVWPADRGGQGVRRPRDTARGHQREPQDMPKAQRKPVFNTDGFRPGTHQQQLALCLLP